MLDIDFGNSVSANYFDRIYINIETSKTLEFSQRKMDIVVVNEMQTLEYDLDLETESFDIELSQLNTYKVDI